MSILTSSKGEIFRNFQQNGCVQLTSSRTDYHWFAPMQQSGFREELDTLPKFNKPRPGKMMVGRLLSFWDVFFFPQGLCWTSKEHPPFSIKKKRRAGKGPNKNSVSEIVLFAVLFWWKKTHGVIFKYAWWWRLVVKVDIFSNSYKYPTGGVWTLRGCLMAPVTFHLATPSVQVLIGYVAKNRLSFWFSRMDKKTTSPNLEPSTVVFFRPLCWQYQLDKEHEGFVSNIPIRSEVRWCCCQGIMNSGRWKLARNDFHGHFSWKWWYDRDIICLIFLDSKHVHILHVEGIPDEQ